ncbi:hypothetical protein NMY22_g19750 [Coprinellus aureogranulatus]|nr:hypothetical protein NMY22_g19750 [Coprinellus aureogranulatus]
MKGELRRLLNRYTRLTFVYMASSVTCRALARCGASWEWLRELGGSVKAVLGERCGTSVEVRSLFRSRHGHDDEPRDSRRPKLRTRRAYQGDFLEAGYRLRRHPRTSASTCARKQNARAPIGARRRQASLGSSRSILGRYGEADNDFGFPENASTRKREGGEVDGQWCIRSFETRKRAPACIYDANRLSRVTITLYMYGKKTKHGWAIPPENGWRTLEKDLYAAVVALSGHYHVPIVLPFLPNAIGYTKMYQNKRDLARRVEEALDWFFVWFGVLSFLLAWLQLNPVVGARHALDHEITAVLLSRGVSPTFVDALMTSLIASQDPERVRRAGTIVDIKKHADYKGHSGEFQPYPNWFTFWGVPVWYTWNSEEEDANGRIHDFRPPAHLFLPPPPSSLQEKQPLSHKPADIPPPDEALVDITMQDPLPSVEVSSAVGRSALLAD